MSDALENKILRLAAKGIAPSVIASRLMTSFQKVNRVLGAASVKSAAAPLVHPEKEPHPNGCQQQKAKDNASCGRKDAGEPSVIGINAGRLKGPAAMSIKRNSAPCKATISDGKGAGKPKKECQQRPDSACQNNHQSSDTPSDFKKRNQNIAHDETSISAGGQDILYPSEINQKLVSVLETKARAASPQDPVGCRLIEGDPKNDPDWRYCQKPQKPGSSYCATHHKRCFTGKTTVNYWIPAQGRGHRSRADKAASSQGE